MAKIRTRIGTGGMLLGIVMLGFLALFPDQGWAACLGIAAAAVLVAAGRGANLHRIPAPACLGLLVAMSLVSLTVTLSPAAARGQLWLLWGSVGAFCLIALWASNRERLTWVGAGLAALAVALALASPFAVNWFTERKTFFPSVIYESFPRLISDTIHPNVMASLMMGLMFVPLAWALTPPQMDVEPLWFSRLMGARWPWVAATCLPALVLLLTKSRGGYAATAVGLVVLALLLARRRRWILWILLGIVIIGGAAAILAQGHLSTTDFGDLESLSTDTIVFRQRVWRYALLLIGDFPFTGIGMRAFNDALAIMYGYRIVLQPGAHNLYLQVALDLGIPGLLAFLTVVGIVLIRAVRSLTALRRTSDPLWVLAAGGIAGVSATLAQGLVDIAAWGTRGSFVLWCLLGLLAALSAHARGLNPARGQNQV
jgi:putative inorganic carbon (HCO3(-)) transporter